MTKASLVGRLEAIDWDFPSDLPGASRNLHWYPGTFPSQLPASIIEGLSSEGDVVWDPFGGVGTVASEAVRLGRRAWSVDSNPVGVLAAYVSCGLLLLNRAKPGAVNEIFTRLIVLVSEGARPLASKFGLGHGSLSIDVDALVSKYVRPAPGDYVQGIRSSRPFVDGLKQWIERRTLEEIMDVRNLILSARVSDFEKLVGLLMCSACLRFSSSQTKSWGHIADNVFPGSFEWKDFYRSALNWLVRTKGVVERANLRCGNGNFNSLQVWVSQHDWNNEMVPLIAPRRKPSLLITSPPYGGAIDYSLAQRLSLYFFGFDEDSIKSLCGSEIGARRKRFRDKSHVTWACQIASAVQRQVSLLSTEAVVVFVLPHKDAGREVGAEAISSVMSDAGFSHAMSVDRSIRQARARQSWTSIVRETVEIYSR